jgi:hypothetical protein
VPGIFGQQLVSTAHHGRFEGSRFGVEAGVQDGGIGLTRTVTDVGSRLEQRYGQLMTG